MRQFQKTVIFHGGPSSFVSSLVAPLEVPRSKNYDALRTGLWPWINIQVCVRYLGKTQVSRKVEHYSSNQEGEYVQNFCVVFILLEICKTISVGIKLVKAKNKM